MTWAAGIGLGLIVLSAVGVVGSAVVVLLPPALRLRRTSRTTQELIEEYRQTMTAELWELRESQVERAALLRPVRRVRRVLTHPLAVALMESYSRRRAASRAAARA